jgi:hypothetical protein
VLVRFDHIARFIVNANHSIMWAAKNFAQPILGVLLKQKR